MLGVKTVGVQLNCLVEEAFSWSIRVCLRFFDKRQAIVERSRPPEQPQVERAVFIGLGENRSLENAEPSSAYNAVRRADLRASKTEDTSW